tara:strand:+ start:1088 stop:1195 length:108 start_codon:yes stop_codon:yes gene_type:complete
MLMEEKRQREREQMVKKERIEEEDFQYKVQQKEKK